MNVWIVSFMESTDSSGGDMQMVMVQEKLPTEQEIETQYEVLRQRSDASIVWLNSIERVDPPPFQLVSGGGYTALEVLRKALLGVF